MTAYMWTGAYKVLPEVPTVTGTVEKDVAFIAPIIGTKTAVSDHRSSQESTVALRNLLSTPLHTSLLTPPAPRCCATCCAGATTCAWC